MIFINTRPIIRAAPLTQALQQHGVTVHDLPLLELLTLRLTATEQQYLQALNQADYAAMVIVSPTAAMLGLETCQQHFSESFRPSCPIITVGQATATALNAIDWQSTSPPSANNESMIQMPELANITKGQKVLIWRGEGGRRLLIDHLQDRGVTVDTIAWYKRQCPSTLIEDFRQLCLTLQTVDNVCVLISSAQAFEYWQNLLTTHNLASAAQHKSENKQVLYLSDFCYIILGERLENILKQHSTKSSSLIWQRIDNLKPSSISIALEQLSKNSTKPKY